MSGVKVENELENKEVIITATLSPGEGPPWSRQALITVGLPDEKVVMRFGKLGDFESIVDELWGEYLQIVNGEVAEPDGEEGDELASVQAQFGFGYSDDDF